MAPHPKPDLSPTLLNVAWETTHFGVLGVPFNATQQTIRKAYLNLAKTYHPDTAVGMTAEEATTAMSQISVAYETLSDPHRRSAYLLELVLNIRRTSSTPPPANRRGHDLEQVIHLTDSRRYTTRLPSGSTAHILLPDNAQYGQRIKIVGEGEPGEPAGNLYLLLVPPPAPGLEGSPVYQKPEYPRLILTEAIVHIDSPVVN